MCVCKRGSETERDRDRKRGMEGGRERLRGETDTAKDRVTDRK